MVVFVDMVEESIDININIKKKIIMQETSISNSPMEGNPNNRTATAVHKVKNDMTNHNLILIKVILNHLQISYTINGIKTLIPVQILTIHASKVYLLPK